MMLLLPVNGIIFYPVPSPAIEPGTFGLIV